MAPKVSETLLEHGRHFYDIDRLLNTPRVVDALRDLGATGFVEPESPNRIHRARGAGRAYHVLRRVGITFGRQQ